MSRRLAAGVPLKPGTRTVSHGTKDGARSRDVVVVLRQTRTIQGVVCRAVWDRLYLDGVLEERTVDWYAQHRNGDVWYFGERTAELDEQGNVVTTEGSWLAGRDGARAGIFMTAHPQVGQTHQQEYYPGHAEDWFRVIDTSADLTVPMLWSTHAVQTEEWTPLEPGQFGYKFYVRDLGVARALVNDPQVGAVQRDVDGVPLPLQATLHRPATCLSSSTTRIRIRPGWHFRLKPR